MEDSWRSVTIVFTGATRVSIWNRVQNWKKRRYLGTCWPTLNTALAKWGFSTGAPSGCFFWCDSHGSRQKLSPRQSFTMHFVPNFIFFTWNGLWEENKNALYAHLCLFGGVDMIIFICRRFILPSSRVLLWRGALSEGLPKQMFLKWQLQSIDFSVRKLGAKLAVKWHSCICQLTGNEMSGLQSTSACLIFFHAVSSYSG